MKWLYKYPQADVPLRRPRDENRDRSRQEPEYELVDTGVFDDGRYWDVFVEYAKAGAGRHPRPGHASTNRGPDEARRSTSCRTSGSATPGSWGRDARRPVLRAAPGRPGGRPSLATDAPDARPVVAPRPKASRRAALHRERDEPEAALAAIPNRTPVREGRLPRVPRPRTARGREPGGVGTKAAAHYAASTVPAAARRSLRLRLRTGFPAVDAPFGGRTSTEVFADRPRPRPTSSTTVAPPPTTSPTTRDGPAPGLRRAALEQAVLSLRRRPTGSKATRPGPPPPPNARRPQRATGRTSSTPT